VLRCEACGHGNRDGAKFCEDCAAPLVALTTPHEVRKTVTVVFCDVAGSTAMGEALDPESVRRVMERYFDAMRTAIEHHGGTVEKYIGDAVMAVFGVPQVHEDDALRAVRAASEMRAALEALNPDLNRDHGMTLACRIGVNTGDVVAGTGDQKIVTGDAVNVAARLEQAAAPGEILLGERTLSLVRDAVMAEAIADLEMKGKAALVPAHRLIDVTSGAAGFARHLDAPIVGRGRELSLLRDVFERSVTDQACQLLTVLGVGGVGKSRLVAAFVDELADRATILRGRCLPYGEGITFHPLAEALIDLANLSEADSPDAARDKLATLVGQDGEAATIAARVGQAIGLTGGESAPDEMRWAIRALLERLATERPVVFVIDDLQWAEPTFLELVEHVADLARDAPILLACMARPELLDDRPGWGGGKLNATSILLEPLNAEECGKLVANLLADDAVDPTVRTRIAEAAEGHPLYAEEITGLMVDEGRLVLKEGRWMPTGDLGDLPIPPTISALLAARLDRLPPSERALIEIASIAGQIFYPAAVRELSSQASDVTDATDAGLAALVRKQFVRPERSDLPATDALGFRHLLIRDAAYGSVPKATRASLHERFADWLDRTAGALGERDEIIGYHLEQAHRYRAELGPADDRTALLARQAAERLAAAGRQASARWDVSATVNLLTRAADLLPAGDALRVEILPDLGLVLAHSDVARGDVVLAEAIDEARAAGDRRSEALAAIRRVYARLLLDPQVDQIGSLRQAEDFAVLFEGWRDDQGSAEALTLIGLIHFWQGKAAAAGEDFERAGGYARRAGNRRQEHEVTRWLALEIAEGPEPVESGIQKLLAILEEGQGDRRVAFSVATKQGMLEAMRGRFEHARELIATAKQLARELGDQNALAAAFRDSGRVEMLDGDNAIAELEMRAAYEIAERMSDVGRLASFAPELGETIYAQGRYEEAQELSEFAERITIVGDVDANVRWRQLRAKTLARSGSFDAAERSARDALRIAADTDYLDLHSEAALSLAEVLRLAGRNADAAQVIGEALELCRRKGNLVRAAEAESSLAELRS
jgi:class 3 adenylate cyclase/tetratricopeptide (TPR) repeat protein